MRLAQSIVALAAALIWPGHAEDIHSDVSEEMKSTGSAGLAETYNRTLHLGKSKRIKLAYPNARFIYVRFAKLDLPPGDTLTLSTNETTVMYKGHGRRRHRPSKDSPSDDWFYSDRLMGDTVEITYKTHGNAKKKKAAKNDQSSFGVTIGSYIRGVARVSDSDGKSFVNPTCVSATPAWQPAACFKESDPLVYESSRSLARMVTLGSSSVAQYATGFLAGCDGYFFTNEHNVRTQAQVDATDFGFLAASAECDDKCNKRALGCPHKLLLRGSATLVAVDTPLDYALLRFDKHARKQLKRLNVSYLSLGSTLGANRSRVVGEQIYIPQHPDGTAAKIATQLQNETDAVIVDANVANRCGKRQLGYMADTIGGSSGAPVIAMKNHRVIGLHHCGECNAGSEGMALRTAIFMHDILADLKKKKVKLPRCFTE